MLEEKKTEQEENMPDMNDLKKRFEEEDKELDNTNNNNNVPTTNKKVGSRIGLPRPSIFRKSGDRAIKKSAISKRDTGKIKTNPKYKCVDEGSEDGLEVANRMGDDA